ASSARRRPTARAEADSSLRARRRIATCASAEASRAWASWSTRRSSGSPANTLSFGLTSTSPMTPAGAAAILISPDAGSTRPGATACQRFSSGVSVRAAFAASSAPILGTSAVNAQAPPMAPRAIRTIILFFRGVTLDHTVVLALSNGLSALALLPPDAPLLDAHHSPRERQYTRIVGHHQDGARGVF